MLEWLGLVRLTRQAEELIEQGRMDASVRRGPSLVVTIEIDTDKTTLDVAKVFRYPQRGPRA